MRLAGKAGIVFGAGQTPGETVEPAAPRRSCSHAKART